MSVCLEVVPLFDDGETSFDFLEQDAKNTPAQTADNNSVRFISSKFSDDWRMQKSCAS